MSSYAKCFIALRGNGLFRFRCRRGLAQTALVPSARTPVGTRTLAAAASRAALPPCVGSHMHTHPDADNDWSNDRFFPSWLAARRT